MRRRRVTKGKLKKADQKFLLVFQRKECLFLLLNSKRHSISLLLSLLLIVILFSASAEKRGLRFPLRFSCIKHYPVCHSLLRSRVIRCLSQCLPSKLEEEGNTRLLCSVSRVSWCCYRSFHFCFRRWRRVLWNKKRVIQDREVLTLPPAKQDEKMQQDNCKENGDNERDSRLDIKTRRYTRENETKGRTVSAQNVPK